MHPTKLLLLTGIAVMLTGCDTGGDSRAPAVTQPATTGTASTPRPLSANYLLRPTDILRVEMYQEVDFKPEVSISQEGDVVLPLIGKVHLAGLTLNEAQQLLTTQYLAYFKQPNVSILLIKYAERKVYLDGMVGRPGPVIFPPEEKMTISRAIASASGILPRGERSDVKLKRIVNGQEITQTVNMDDISAGKAQDIELFENDYIYVRDSRI